VRLKPLADDDGMAAKLAILVDAAPAGSFAIDPGTATLLAGGLLLRAPGPRPFHPQDRRHRAMEHTRSLASARKANQHQQRRLYP
jgi:hypothetical protein